MKRLFFVAAGCFLGAWVFIVQADNLAFPVTLRQGQAETDDGVFGINRGKVVGEDHLVLVVDRDGHEIRLQQVDDDTNLVATIAQSTFAGILSNGAFAAIMEFSDWEIPNLDINSGAALIKGELRETSNSVSFAKGRITGVLNDSVNGDSTGDDRLFQIVIKPTGVSFDADDFGL